MADSSFDETVDKNPVIFENGSKARLLMNKYYSMPSITCLSRFFPSPVFPARETCSKSRYGRRGILVNFEAEGRAILGILFSKNATEL